MAACFKDWMCLRVIRPFGVALAHLQTEVLLWVLVAVVWLALDQHLEV